MNEQAIYEEIELHADNGVPPAMLVELVAEVLEISKAKVRKVWKQWMKDSGWEV